MYAGNAAVAGVEIPSAIPKLSQIAMARQWHAAPFRALRGKQHPGPTSFIQLITGIVEALGDKESRPRPKSSTPTRRHRVYLTAQQVDEMAAAYQAGATTKELASEYGIHRHTVSIYLRRRGEPRRHEPMGSEEVALARKNRGYPW
jgi:hypothetical protein